MDSNARLDKFVCECTNTELKELGRKVAEQLQKVGIDANFTIWNKCDWDMWNNALKT